ncbi:hypothetical protein KXQ82_04495 [Mucilaginibacter sp. HMF5004]|uniref:hypothetical protein n=1 Tax=Mucilaginibacter rivuli TaxID=2857527 RepID=UPI001C5E0F70|nr:hypothetical protein [Mucilaginibacter rivuli]MBW4888957.1 hypothetical protein [Mucilaginibacter rivuli]
MKKQQVLDSLWSALRAALQYWNDQAASQQAMEHVYVRKWHEDEPVADYAVQILINPHGSIFKVTHRHFVNGNLLREESYLATYGWHSNGHLIALGRERYLVFDPAQRQLYLEDWPESGERSLEIFEKL